MMLLPLALHVREVLGSVIEYSEDCIKIKHKETPWLLVQTSDRRWSAKLLPTFAGRGCGVISVTNPHGR
jgi:hypothetical protein